MLCVYTASMLSSIAEPERGPYPASSTQAPFRLHDGLTPITGERSLAVIPAPVLYPSLMAVQPENVQYKSDFPCHGENPFLLNFRKRLAYEARRRVYMPSCHSRVWLSIVDAHPRYINVFRVIEGQLSEPGILHALSACN